jgi:hypothetical protein
LTGRIPQNNNHHLGTRMPAKRLPGKRRVSFRPSQLLAIHFIMATASFIPANVNDISVCFTTATGAELDSLRGCAKVQYNAQPSDPEIQMSYARLMKNADSACVIYRKITASEKATPALQAEANFRLACVSFLSANYTKAEAYLELEKKDAYVRLFNRTVILAGDDSLRSALDSGNKVGINPEKIEKKTSTLAYYLQIAAFSESENAQDLKRDLLRLFPNIVIKESRSHGKTVFRVRIGPFSGNKDAQAFGDSALVKNKISFRVIEDVREKSATFNRPRATP